MCGITGFVDFGQRKREPLTALRAMNARLLHRGPDGGGEWFDADTGVGFGHRRLAIVDLSPHGAQPMHSASGRYALVFNGEIFDYASLRAELEKAGAAPAWRGHSDTEVMLAAFEHWGIATALPRLGGQFAFVLLDRRERTLTLARDRLGEKPLYYGFASPASRGSFVFGSELKALRAHPDWRGEIDRDAAALYFRYGCVPAPRSIYRGIYKLPPASFLTLPLNALRSRSLPQPQSYWSLDDAAARAGSFTGSLREAEDELDTLLANAVRLCMVADVPLGAFLSGGIDSSAVVAQMQALSSRPVKTFSIGFDLDGYNEAPQARAVAEHLGTDHTELIVKPAQALEVIPQLPELYDEPFADSSQIPTFLVSRLARQQVTVALSGDAGDELFGGYNRHLWAPRVQARSRLMPRPLRHAAASALGLLSPEQWDRAFATASPLLPRFARQRLPGDKLHKLAAILAADSGSEIYRALVSAWPQPQSLVLGSHDLAVERAPPAALTELAQQMMYWDMAGYLPDDILAKVDRASMGVSLEARVPFLDPHVVAFAGSLPLSLKIRDGQGKWLLRRVLERRVPKALFDRPKTGFAMPVGDWLRGPLRAWAESLIADSALRAEGFLDAAQVGACWREHLSGRRNRHARLWPVLMFQAWLRHEGGA